MISIRPRASRRGEGLKNQLPTQRNKKVYAVLAMTLLVAKMILFERVNFGQPPFEFVLVSAIIPLALLFGTIGIVGMSVGCTLAHAFNFIGVADVLGAGISVFLGCSLAYRFVQKSRFAGRYFLANLIITAFMTILMGASYAYINNIPFEMGMLAVFGSIWIGVNIVGYLLLLVVGRVLSNYGVIDQW